MTKRVPILLGAGLALVAAAAFLLWPREPAPTRSADDLLRAGQSACERIEFEGSRFTACRYRRGEDEIALFADGQDGRPLRSLAALETDLGERAAQLRFAMNAGMFDGSGRPIGLYIADGQERRALNRRDGPGNFHLQPNGVFGVDATGRVAVTPTARFRAEAVKWATQSGPLLVIDGALHPAFSEDGASLNVRNGVGVADPDTAWFAISEQPVSFGRFARLFRDRLGCANALFLDGSVSSLWDRPALRRDAFPLLGPMVAVFAAPASTRSQSALP